MKVTFQVCDLFKKTVKDHPEVIKAIKDFQHTKAANPMAPFGSSDYPFRHSFLKGYIHAKLNFDVSIIYSISGTTDKVIKLYGVFSHDESGTGQPPNLKRQDSLSKKLSNQTFKEGKSSMRPRNIYKMNRNNDGSRTLFESILCNEVELAFKGFAKAAISDHFNKFVLLGGLALSYHTRPRFTSDVDVLFLDTSDIPMAVDGFKRNRPSAFIHRMYGVEVEVMTPNTINMTPEIAKYIYNTAGISQGVRVASPAGVVVSKLGRFSRQDQTDIASLCECYAIDLSEWPIPELWMERFLSIKNSL